MTTAQELLRVLVCDDHPVHRDGFSKLLTSLDGLEVVGTAADGVQAVRLTGDLQPDVVVMDLQMPELNGADATARMTAEHPHVAVLVLTMYDDDESVFAAMRAGARGYLLKGAAQDVIARAITSVAQGEAIFGPAVARRVAAYSSGEAPSRPASPPEAFPQLTAREREVLDLLAAGRTNAQIASALFLSPDRPQRRSERLRQAAGGRTQRGDRPGARRRAGALRTRPQGAPQAASARLA